MGPNGTLGLMVKLWPTPAARDHKGANSEEHLTSGTGHLHLDQLPNFVEHLWNPLHWPTACVTDSVGVRNATSGRGNLHSKHHSGATLNDVIQMWPTPTSLSFGESHQPGNSVSYNKTMSLASHLPDHPISTVGEEFSKLRRTLNPLFVEWLMMWPRGWTCLALTSPASIGSACSETELSLFKKRMRSALSQLASPSAPPPAQIDLFA